MRSFMHAAFGLEEEEVVEVEVGGRGSARSAPASAHWSRGGAPVEAAVGDWWYSPSTQAHRVRFSASRLAGGLGGRGGCEPGGAKGSEEAFDFSLVTD